MIRYSILRWTLRLLILVLVLTIWGQNHPELLQQKHIQGITLGKQKLASDANIRNRVIVKVPPEKLADFAEKAGIDESHSEVNPLGMVMLNLEEAELADEKSAPYIEFVEPDYPVHAAEWKADPLFSEQWHHAALDTLTTWNMKSQRKEIIVAVLDSGVVQNHPDLRGRLVPGYDFVENDEFPQDENGHGTHVTGIISGAVNNGEGIAGMCPNCKVMPLRVLDANASGTLFDVASAITYAADSGAQVINMSLTSKVCSATLQIAIDYAWSKGVLLLAAAGNNGSSVPEYPAACERVLSVSAVNDELRLPTFANRGDTIDFVAPGTSILSTTLQNDYTRMFGTSMATPIVAGFAALLWGATPEMSNAELETLMKESAFDLGELGKDSSYGYGLIDIPRSNGLEKLRIAKEFGFSLELQFLPVPSASVISIEYSSNLGRTWEVAKTAMPIRGDSTSAVLFGLSPGRLYAFRLHVVGGPYEGYSVPVQYQTAKDSIPPTSPDYLKVNWKSSDEIALSWLPAKDNVGISHYEVFDGADLIGTSEKPTFIAKRLSSNTTYTFSVSAVDRSNNRSARSSLLAASTTAEVVYYQHTIQVDGINDFSKGSMEQLLSQSSGVKPYLTWDKQHIYVGLGGNWMQQAKLNRGKTIQLYFSGDVNVRLTKGLSAKQNQVPLGAKFACEVNPNRLSADCYSWLGKSWVKTASSSNVRASFGREIFELGIPRSELGDTTTVGFYATTIESTTKAQTTGAQTTVQFFDLQSMLSSGEQTHGLYFRVISAEKHAVTFAYSQPIGAEQIELLMSSDKGKTWIPALPKYSISTDSTGLRIDNLKSGSEYGFRLRVVGGRWGGPAGNSLGGSAVVRAETKSN